MRICLFPATALIAVFFLSYAPALPAQSPDSLVAVHPRIAPLWSIGEYDDELLRLEQILGQRTSRGYLIRTPSTLSPPAAGADGAILRAQVISPELRLIHNSDLPTRSSDGALWAGRGTNTRFRLGARFGAGPVDLVLAPELVVSENLEYQTVPYQLGDRPPLASPWSEMPGYIDLPSRFGTEPLRELRAGQSSITVRIAPIALGVATENQWWGPGIRNAIVMSDNAPGIPHAFLRTASPLRTRIGEFEGRWIVGSLRQSEHFDTLDVRGKRSISAAVATFRPAAESGLTLGVSRAVYATSENGVDIGSALDVIRSVPRTTEPGVESSSDQIFSLFGRWIFPESGFETYAEWSRLEFPTSLRDLLSAAHHTQGYTLGAQWARAFGASSRLRLQAEATYLEQSGTGNYRPVPSYYRSSTVPQGYTHEGRVIGAAIGPSGSSQWIASDWIARRWTFGVYGERIRWDNDAIALAILDANFFDHDVSLATGARASYTLGWARIAAGYTLEKRFNYLFQNRSENFDDQFGLDIRNQTFRLTVTALPGVAR
jgi:hypothetical protein